MAIVACSECNEKLSTLAQTCPHCGAPGPAQLSSAIPVDSKLSSATVRSEAPALSEAPPTITPAALKLETKDFSEKPAGKLFQTAVVPILVGIFLCTLVVMGIAWGIAYLSKVATALHDGLRWQHLTLLPPTILVVYVLRQLYLWLRKN